eukprot:g80893.t1
MEPAFADCSRLPVFLAYSQTTHTRNTIIRQALALNAIVPSPVSQQAPCTCPQLRPAAAAQAAVHSIRGRVFADDWEIPLPLVVLTIVSTGITSTGMSRRVTRTMASTS